MLKTRNIILVTLILINTYIVIFFLNYLYYLSPSTEYNLLLLAASVFVIIFTFLILLFLKSYTELAKKEVENESLKHYVDKTKKIINTLNSKTHEHKRHLQVIQSMLNLDEITDAKKYINEIAKNNSKKSEGGSYLYVKEPVLNLSLNAQKKVAEEKDINFNIGIKSDITKWGINPWDLNSIICNLIDNSFEAVSRNNDNEKKYVAIELLEDPDNGLYLINAINNGPKISKPKQEKIFEPGYTSKKTVSSGYGLYIVNRVVKNNRGTIEIKSDSSKTVFSIKFPGKGELKTA
ncbi:sensor histidine kinase [Natranaerobius thermophilus]|uniref:Signal transduction histidine kinase regulating citrate/malate metabolism n=1 Tax=Natranaerobius thermophilus (strain ATCC BAA-1301 / DSM 18059 / JW/NM-WN-LF) TaxID=457570 RepID=B2A279_NATTJ|nr:ATP-binding protein [Natranaerobius thermophilus]ACB86187.1 signal transduction histidine kinase regulating citrate/malate metabolism [Natranaerobius thermophilus JW/NM-WN-LF]